MNIALIDHPIIQSLLIVYRNDSSTPFRAKLLEQAKARLNMDAEKVLIQLELEQMPAQKKRAIAQVEAEFEMRKEDLQRHLEWGLQ
jgi:hypothetical protein